MTNKRPTVPTFRWQLLISIFIFFLVNSAYSESPVSIKSHRFLQEWRYRFRGGDEKFSKEVTKIDYSKSPFSFSLFQDKDGSQTDPDGIPSRYLAMQNNRRDRAKKAFEATLKWREENDIDTILARPHPNFDICKRIFPFYFCGRDDSGRLILLQRPGIIDLELVEKNKISPDELLNHYIYAMEYLWQLLEPESDALMTSIIDLTGLSFSVIRRGELLKFIQKFCNTMDSHFPQRAHRTLLINSPKWFNALFKFISPILRESTRKKITMLSKGQEQDKVLESLCPGYITESNQPLHDMMDTEMEEEFRTFVS